MTWRVGGELFVLTLECKHDDMKAVCSIIMLTTI